MQECPWMEQYLTSPLPEDRHARDVAIADAAAALIDAEHTLKTTVDRVQPGGGTDSDITAARDALDAAYRADAAARQPVNFPFEEWNHHLVAHLATWQCVNQIGQAEFLQRESASCFV